LIRVGATGDPARGSCSTPWKIRPSSAGLTVRRRLWWSVRQPRIVSVESYVARQWR